jgi:hypothetical protein
MAKAKAAPVKQKEAEENPHATRTKCQISREDFVKHAPKQIPVTIAGQPHVAELKEFSSGSFGWNLNDKMFVRINDVDVKVQLGLNMTVVGSKDAE